MYTIDYHNGKYLVYDQNNIVVYESDNKDYVDNFLYNQYLCRQLSRGLDLKSIPR